MAIFKPFRGNRSALDAQPLHDGYAYFCIDDGTFHIDYVDADGNLQRKQLNAKDAETLSGISLDELKEEIKNDYTLLVEEKTKDCPRTEMVVTEVINGEYTSAPVERFGGAFGSDMMYYEELPGVPEVINLVLDGVEYNNLNPIVTDIGPLVGNLAMLNPLLGTSFEDTGESFVMGVGYAGCLLATDITQSTTHSVIISCPVETVIKIDWAYLPEGVSNNGFVMAYTSDIISQERQQRSNTDKLLQEADVRLQKEIDNEVIVAVFDIPDTIINYHMNIFNSAEYNIEVDWGDGTVSKTGSHAYRNAGTYTCKIYGLTEIPEYFINSNLDSCAQYLTDIKIPNSITSIGAGAFAGCTALTNIEIPDSVTKIWSHAFSYCTSLTKVVIPDSVTYIAEFVFDGCIALESVVIGASVETLHNYVFENCTSLVDLIFKRAEPIYQYVWFGGESRIKQLEHIYVPYGCADAYRTRWSEEDVDQSTLDIIIESDRAAMMSDLNNFEQLMQEYLSLDYSTLAFDTTEVVIASSAASSILGQAILGQLVLA